MTENLLEIARKQYADVKSGFDINKSLQYNLGVEALTSTLRLITTPDAIQFAEKYLFQIVNILLDQSPMKLGTFEKGRITESLQLSVEIAVNLLPSHPHFVNVLARMFDINAVFYAGVKTYYHHYSGYPYVRTELIIKFTNLSGFKLLYRALFEPETRWPGAMSMFIFFKALNTEEVLTVVSDEIRNNLLTKTMDVMLNLTDEQLKKESCDSLTPLFRTMCYVTVFHDGAKLKQNEARGMKKLEPFYQFWFSFVLRLMKSGSLVLKLLAWDLAHELVTYAIEARPSPRCYEVEGSSVDFINGIYLFTRFDKSVPVYEKPSTRSGDPPVSLFRFGMKDKSFRWFLCTLKAGSADIDYYEDKATAGDRKLPSSNDWIGAGSYQKAIPPTLKPMGYLLMDGAT